MTDLEKSLTEELLELLKEKREGFKKSISDYKPCDKCAFKKAYNPYNPWWGTVPPYGTPCDHLPFTITTTGSDSFILNDNGTLTPIEKK